MKRSEQSCKWLQPDEMRSYPSTQSRQRTAMKTTFDGIPESLTMPLFDENSVHWDNVFKMHLNMLVLWNLFRWTLLAANPWGVISSRRKCQNPSIAGCYSSHCCAQPPSETVKAGLVHFFVMLSVIYRKQTRHSLTKQMLSSVFTNSIRRYIGLTRRQHDAQLM